MSCATCIEQPLPKGFSCYSNHAVGICKSFCRAFTSHAFNTDLRPWHPGTLRSGSPSPGIYLCEDARIWQNKAKGQADLRNLMGSSCIKLRRSCPGQALIRPNPKADPTSHGTELPLLFLLSPLGTQVRQERSDLRGPKTRAQDPRI